MKDTLWTIKPNRHFNLFWQYRNQPADTRADRCPYCESREVVKRGRRHKKFETVQLYRCKACTKTFSAQIVKGKHYPLRMILDAVSLYNLGYIRSEVCRLSKKNTVLKLSHQPLPTGSASLHRFAATPATLWASTWSKKPATWLQCNGSLATRMQLIPCSTLGSRTRNLAMP